MLRLGLICMSMISQVPTETVGEWRGYSGGMLCLCPKVEGGGACQGDHWDLSSSGYPSSGLNRQTEGAILNPSFSRRKPRVEHCCECTVKHNRISVRHRVPTQTPASMLQLLSTSLLCWLSLAGGGAILDGGKLWLAPGMLGISDAVPMRGC